MYRLLLPATVLLVVVVALFKVDENQPESDFVFINRGDVFTLDPQRMSWLNDMQMAYCLYEGLVRWNTEDFSIELAAADSADVSPDGLVYTFHIREDAAWSNGASVSAYDFQYAWMRLLTPDYAADYSDFFFLIKGAGDYWEWRSEQLKNKKVVDEQLVFEQFKQVVGIRVVNSNTIEIQLEKAVPYFLDQLALAVCSPVYKPAVEGWVCNDEVWDDIIVNGWWTTQPPPASERKWFSVDQTTGRFKQSHLWARPGRLVSNGPFILDQWRYKRDMRLVTNPYFHSSDTVAIDSIEAITIPDTNTAVMAFEAGEADWLNGVNVDYQADMLHQKSKGERANIHAIPTFGTDFFSFNCRQKLNNGLQNPFHDSAVRRAFVYATDRAAIVQHATRLNEPVVSSFVPPQSIGGYTTVNGITFDESRAHEELRAAGWEDRDGDKKIENEHGEPFPVIEILYTTNTPRYKWVALELRDQWQQRLGVRVELRGTDNKFFSADLKSGNFMIARGRWYGDYGDPTTFLDVFKSTNGNNDRGYENPEIDRLLELAANELDLQIRMQLLCRVEKILFEEEVPMLVICQLLQLYMYEPDRVSGLTTHPRLSQQLWRVKVSDQ